MKHQRRARFAEFFRRHLPRGFGFEDRDLLFQSGGILMWVHLEPVADDGNARHREPPQFVGVTYETIVERARLRSSVVSVDDLPDCDDDALWPAGRFQHLARKPEAFIFMQDSDVGCIILGPKPFSMNSAISIDRKPMSCSMIASETTSSSASE